MPSVCRRYSLKAYNCPHWAAPLTKIPNSRICLAQKNTPIRPWLLPNVSEAFSVSVKRDDLTGCLLTGNKTRKLEFLLADAVEKNCKHVITTGGIQSNHCRTTAVAARELGLKPHLFLLSEDTPDTVSCHGNTLLDIMCGANIVLVNKSAKHNRDALLKNYADHISNETGESCYVIPVGGSNCVGLFGFVDFFEELLNQQVHENFDDIVLAIGSGGSTAGIAIANFLTGGKLKIHAVSVCNDNVYFHKHISSTLKSVGLRDVDSEDIVDIIDGHKGLGYAKSASHELEFIMQVCITTGIFLDPVYTAKAALGLVHELNHNPSRFKGNRILFIHTGGIFGIMDGRMEPHLRQSGRTENQVKLANEIV